MAEIRGFEAITKLSEFPDILQRIQNYPAFLQSREKISSPMKMIIDMSGGTRIVEVANMTSAVRNLFCTAHFAACCILLEDFRIMLDVLRSISVVPHIQQYLANSSASEVDQDQVIMRRLVGMDATRTMQLLRAFGLVTRRSNEMYQIGLGAGDGDKDFNFMHTDPVLRMEAGPDGQEIVFGSSRKRVADIIVNDLDPRHKSKYEQLSQDASSPVTGYVGDTLGLLEKLSGGNIRKRNLVTALRIDPAMIPNASEFLRYLYPILDEDCDLVLSMGAGESPDAYQRRLDVVSDMFSTLEGAQLEPVLFRLHLGGAIERQGASIQFGSIGASSYEILYCRLSSEALCKAFIAGKC